MKRYLRPSSLQTFAREKRFESAGRSDLVVFGVLLLAFAFMVSCYAEPRKTGIILGACSALLSFGAFAWSQLKCVLVFRPVEGRIQAVETAFGFTFSSKQFDYSQVVLEVENVAAASATGSEGSWMLVNSRWCVLIHENDRFFLDIPGKSTERTDATKRLRVELGFDKTYTSEDERSI